MLVCECLRVRSKYYNFEKMIYILEMTEGYWLNIYAYLTQFTMDIYISYQVAHDRTTTKKKQVRGTNCYTR